MNKLHFPPTAFSVVCRMPSANFWSNFRRPGSYSPSAVNLCITDVFKYLPMSTEFPHEGLGTHKDLRLGRASTKAASSSSDRFSASHRGSALPPIMPCCFLLAPAEPKLSFGDWRRSFLFLI